MRQSKESERNFEDRLSEEEQSIFQEAKTPAEMARQR